jgi:hypothetical protein
MPVFTVDWAASPVLTRLRELIGEDATLAIIRARGGQRVRLPASCLPDHWLAQLIGLQRAQAVCGVFGGADPLTVPTGAGLAHGRRIDPETVAVLTGEGKSANAIANALDCTQRQIRNIRRKVRDESARARDRRQPKLL